jgi:isopenicillin N synthase-like dioxygenase
MPSESLIESHNMQVPVVDLELVKNGDPNQLSLLAYGLGDLGLIHIKNHQIPSQDLNRFYALFDDFCSRPLEEKSKLSHGDIWFQRGWTPPDTERAVLAGGQPDFKECYFATAEDLDPLLQAEYPQIFADNVWPEDTKETGFDEVYLSIGHQLHTIGLVLLEGIALALNLPKDCFTSFVKGGAHVTRALHYLPLNESQVDSDIRWGEEHTDFNLLTLLPGGRFYYDDHSVYEPKGISGLYLRARGDEQHPQGRRVKGSAPKGCIIAQVGQQLEILTGGELLATPHEILPPKDVGVHRSSMAHFIHAHPHQVLTPFDQFKTAESIQAYRPPVLAGNYALKTLVDIGLAPADELGMLGYRHYRRLEDQRTQEGR